MRILYCWALLVASCSAGSNVAKAEDAARSDELKVPVSCVLTKVVAEHHQNETYFRCAVELNNRTGKTLVVKSRFSSAFDGFSLLIADMHGRQLLDRSYSYHQSPHLQLRDFLVKPGKTKRELLFPINNFGRPGQKFKVRLAGFLSYSAHEDIVETKRVTVEVIKERKED